MPTPSVTLLGSGLAPSSTAADVLVASIINLVPGRYKIWGRGRHTLADGLKLSSPVVINFASGPNESFDFGPIVVDITSSAIGIGMALRLATGASDTASANLYAERITGGGG